MATVAPLKAYFDALTKRAVRKVYWTDHGQYWEVTSGWIYSTTKVPKGMPETSEVHTKQGCASIPALEKNRSLAYPENTVKVGYTVEDLAVMVPIYGNLITLDGAVVVDGAHAPVDGYLTTLDGIVGGRGVHVPVRMYTPPTGLPKCDKYIGISKGDAGLLAILKTENEALYISMYIPDKPDKLEITYKNKKYTAVDWQEKTKSWKGWATMPEIGGIKLPDLGNSVGKASVKNMVAVMQAIASDSKTQAEKDTEKVKEALGDIPIESLDDSSVLDEAAAAVEAKPEAPKRTRRKPEKKAMISLKETIEAVGAALPETFTIEEALAESRDLRDLQIVCARRAANITAWLSQKSVETDKALTAIKAVLK